MSVVARRVVSSPERTTSATWEFVTALVCQGDDSSTKEFNAVLGLAGACISEEALRDHALVIVGQGSRLRIYCLFGDEAISGDKRNEDPLTWKPTDGKWKAYLPCTEEDWEWMKKAVPAKSSCFEPYSIGEGLPSNLKESEDGTEAKIATKPLTIDTERFKQL